MSAKYAAPAWLLIWLSFFFVSPASIALEPEKLLELKDRIRLAEQMTYLEAGVALSMAALRKENGLTGEQGEWTTRLAEAFDANRSTDIVSRHLAEALTDEQADQITDWYGQPLGKQVLALDLAAIQPGHAGRAAAPAGTSAVPARRQTLIREMIDLLTGKELAQTMFAAVQIASQTTGTSAQSSQADAERKEIRRLAEQTLQAMQPIMIADMENHLANVYRELDDQSLMAYRDFLRTPAMRSFNNAFHSAVKEILEAFL